MPKYYSTSFGVFGVHQWKKMAKNGAKLHEITPKKPQIFNIWLLILPYGIPNGNGWVYIAVTDIPKHYSSSFGALGVHKGEEKGPKYELPFFGLLSQN